MQGVLKKVKFAKGTSLRSSEYKPVSFAPCFLDSLHSAQSSQSAQSPQSPHSPHSLHSPRHHHPHQQKHNHQTHPPWPRAVANNSTSSPWSLLYPSPCLITTLTSMTCILTFLLFTGFLFWSAPPGERGLYGFTRHGSLATNHDYDNDNAHEANKGSGSLTRVFSIGVISDHGSMKSAVANEQGITPVPITIPLMSKVKHELLRDVVCYLHDASVAGHAGDLDSVAGTEREEKWKGDEVEKEKTEGEEEENENGIPNECTWLVRKEEWFHGHEYEHGGNSTLAMGVVGSGGEDGDGHGYSPWECDLILGNRMYIPRGALPIRLPIPSLSPPSPTKASTKFIIDFSLVPCGPISTSTSTSSSTEQIPVGLPTANAPSPSNNCTTAFRLGIFRLRLDTFENVNPRFSSSSLPFSQPTQARNQRLDISHSPIDTTRQSYRNPATITTVNIIMTGTSLDSDPLVPEKSFQFQVRSSFSSPPNIEPEYIDIDLPSLNLSLVRKLDFAITTTAAIFLEHKEQEAEVDLGLQLSFDAVDSGVLLGKTRGEVGLEVFVCRTAE